MLIISYFFYYRFNSQQNTISKSTHLQQRLKMWTMIQPAFRVVVQRSHDMHVHEISNTYQAHIKHISSTNQAQIIIKNKHHIGAFKCVPPPSSLLIAFQIRAATGNRENNTCKRRIQHLGFPHMKETKPTTFCWQNNCWQDSNLHALCYLVSNAYLCLATANRMLWHRSPSLHMFTCISVHTASGSPCCLICALPVATHDP